MQENEFEKQVQEKMDELRLHPSDAVWLKVEAEIKKEKRRRWGLILFPVLVLGLLYGGYLLVKRDNSNGKEQQPTNNFTTKNKIDTTNKTTISTSDPIINNEPLITNKTTYPQSNIKYKLHAKKVVDKQKFSSDYKIANTSEKQNSQIFQSETDTTSIVKNENLNPYTPQATSQSTIGKDSVPGQDNKSIEVANDLNNDKKRNETTADTTSTTKKITNSKKHSWNFGFSFSGGISGTSINSGTNQNSSQNYSPIPASGYVGSTPLFGPSSIKPSIAFITGIAAEKNISSKLIFSTGLNYKLFSTTNLVGRDSINTFMTYPLTSKHHNFFHYIDVPVTIKAEISNSPKVPVYWNFGLSISRLIASNALQFNYATYFHDNSQFNKTQFGIHSGFDISLISKQKISFLVGPYFNYTISKIAKQGYYNHHFNFIGLHSQFIFRKK